MLRELEVVLQPDTRRRARWDERCSAVLVRFAGRCSNAEIADLIAAETGMRFKVKTVSDHRAALGLDSHRLNDWSAPLTRTRMIRRGRR